MKMAIRYSGNATIRVTYRDSGDYACSVSVAGRSVWSGTVGAPASGFGPGVAYDSPEAYDSTARAALAFAEEDTGGDAIQPDWEEGSGERQIRR